MNPGIIIEYKNPQHKLMKCVYKITIGNRFYIGQCMRLAERMYQHQGHINRCLKRYTMPKETEISYIPIVRYLHENPKISTLQVEVVQRCITAWDLSYAEKIWLSDYMSNPDCLNGTFIGSFYPNHDIWDVELDRLGQLRYFDPFDPDKKKYHAWTPLNKTGFITAVKAIPKGCMNKFTYIGAVETKPDHTA